MLPTRGRVRRKGALLRVYCAHGVCNINSVDNEDIALVPFPKPCNAFILSVVDDNTPHNTKQCTKCSKCLRWIHLCKRSDSRLQKLEDINKRTYVCANHFANGLGPTDTDPDPCPATKPSLTGETAPRPFRRPAPKSRGELCTLPAKRRRTQPNVGLDLPVCEDQPEDVALEVGPTAAIQPDPNFGVSVLPTTPTHPANNQISGATQVIDTKSTLLQIAQTLLEENVNIRFNGDLVTVLYIKDNLVLKTCTIDKQFNVKLIILNKPIDSDHSIWKSYPKQWYVGFNFIEFIKDLFENWHACESCSDSSVVTKIQGKLNEKDSFRFDSLTNSIRSKDCNLLSKKPVCFYCRKMIRNYRYKFQNTVSKSRPIKPKISHMTRNEALETLRQTKVKMLLEKRKNKRLRTKLKSLIGQGIRVTDADNNDFLSILSSDDNKTPSSALARIFFQEQIKAAKVKSSKGHRWHPLLIKWCLYLRTKSASTYSALRKVITLPSERRLYDLQTLNHVNPGFHDHVLGEIVKEFNESGNEDHRRYCSLLLDEVKIQEDLVYKGSTGELIGFVELGSTDQLLEKMSSEALGIRKTDQPLATHILQLMVRGITSSIEATYAYFPTKSIKAHHLLEVVWEAVRLLEGRDVRVLVLVSDGAAANRSMYRLSADEGTTWYTKNIFAPERQIYFVCDAPHLLKTTRNAFSNSGSHKKSRLLWKNGKHIEWSHIVTAYKKDLSSSFRILSHISHDHLYLTPSTLMRVKFAAQVLSKRMAVALGELGGDETTETVIFIEMFNKFFDLMNTRHLKEGVFTRNPDVNAYTSPNDERLTWLNGEFLSYLEEWKNEVKERTGFTPQQRNKMLLSRETQEGLYITVKSVTAAVKFMLDAGAPFVLTSKFNQDPLEMIFSKHRGASGANTNPNVTRYGDNFGKLQCLKEYAYFGKGNVSQSK